MTGVSGLAPGLLLLSLGVIVRALACDYDGTLATADRIGPAALEALSRGREAGLKIILVTGRSFFELTRVCERLDLFDAVVAENGGVIYAKYADARVGVGRRFAFRHPDGHEVASAESLSEFLRVVERVDPGVLDWHARRGDFSRWARDVFSDEELGRQLRKTENRWARGELAELAQSLARPIQARYGA